MKKSLLALAVLGAFAGVASAQSSVTMYGTIDLSIRYINNDGADKYNGGNGKDRWSMSQDGINSSQLGFRGIEDLGGGLKAGFVLLAGVNADNGTSNMATVNGTSVSRLFNRRSTMSLLGNWGELRLGRDYTPTFWTQTVFDAFGTNGVGSSLNVAQFYNGTRQDNTIAYLTPANIGGFYGWAQYGFGEKGVANDKHGDYYGLRGGFAAGPFDVALAYAQQKFDVAQGAFSKGDNQKTWNLGGSWNFGFMTLLGYYQNDKASITGVGNVTEDRFHPSIVVPFGQSEIHFGYDWEKGHIDALNETVRVQQIKATYQYNVSKRTAVYTTLSQLKNDSLTRTSITDFAGTVGSNPGNPEPGGKSTGFEFGMRHFF
jgi:predicted porin